MNRYLLSIDLGGTNTKIALFNSKLSLKAKTSFFTKKFFSNRDKLLSEIIKRSFALIDKNHIRHDQVLAMGIGVPGLVDFAKGKVYYLPNVPHWKNTPLKKVLEKRTRFKVFVDNDVNLMALAELRLGAAKKAKNAVCLTLGTGVGGGLILNGQLFRGSSYCSGEIGHIPLNIWGNKCSCGGRGCLETYVGNKIILSDAKKKLKIKNLTLERLSELYKKKNRIAIKIYNNFAENIGIALVGVVNVLNPDAIIIGGGLSFAGDFVFKKIKQVIRMRAMPVQSSCVKIYKTSLGRDSGLIGAAILARDNLKARNPH